ncbi:MAG: hypothetical protein ACTSSI_16190, partial [Candidatus Helarchaeota archaeon]
MNNNYGDIPEDVRAKPFLPTMQNWMWKIFKALGWEQMEKYIHVAEDCAYYFFEDRLNESISTAQAVYNGKITEHEKVLSYITAIPPLTIRSDLCQGTTKLIGGESLDVTWIPLSDFNQEVFMLLNTHLEDGIPVDWWIVNRDDELLDRRHMKLGYKIRDMPTRMRDFTKFGNKVKSVLMDIRNERTPQWNSSHYITAPVWTSYAVEEFMASSNFESIAGMYFGWATKDKYKLPDYCYTLHPWPSILNMMYMGGMEALIYKLSGLTTRSQFYIQPIEKRTMQHFHDNMPSAIDLMKESYAEGFPFPIQTIKLTMPNIKSKNAEIRFQKQYPKGKFIKMEDLNITFEDAVNGIFTNITHETDPSEKIDESRIIS